MSELAVKRPLARPRFIKSSLIAFVLVLPFAIHAMWGYIETRRLKHAIDAIEAKGEPILVRSPTPTGDAARAERYYRAAAALASEFRPDPRGWYGQIAVAERTHVWPDDLVPTLRALLQSYEETLSFVDRAADLPFEGFGPGTTYSYLASGLIDAIRLSTLRGVVKSFDGEADAAVDSLYAAARAGRWFNRTRPSFVSYSLHFTSAINLVLERSRPNQAPLQRLASALEDPDQDDVLTQTFLAMRAGLLQERSANPWFIGPRTAPVLVVTRPWQTHQVNSQLAVFSVMLEAADAPWPDRIDRVIATDARDFSPRVQFTPERMQQLVSGFVTPLASIRALRSAVAIERYRRDHDEQLPESLAAVVPSYLASAPVDPFTGQPLRYTRNADGYVVYSLGSNRTDDGGDVAIRWVNAGDRGTPDPGIRIRYVNKRRE